MKAVATSAVYDPDGTIRDALHKYFETYASDVGGYDDAYHVVKVLGFLPLIIPNPPARRRALRRHDLNHVLASYEAVLKSGEIDIAGFEIGSRGGCRGFWVAWYINLFVFAIGLLSRPKQLFLAFVRSRGALNAYSLADVDDAFLNRRLHEVREEFRIPDRGPDPTFADRFYFLSWSVVSVLLALTSSAILLGLLAVLANGLWTLVFGATT